MSLIDEVLENAHSLGLDESDFRELSRRCEIVADRWEIEEQERAEEAEDHRRIKEARE